MKDSTQPHLFNVCYVNIYDNCGVHCETEFCESDPEKNQFESSNWHLYYTSLQMKNLISHPNTISYQIYRLIAEY